MVYVMKYTALACIAALAGVAGFAILKGLMLLPVDWAIPYAAILSGAGALVVVLPRRTAKAASTE